MHLVVEGGDLWGIEARGGDVEGCYIRYGVWVYIYAGKEGSEGEIENSRWVVEEREEGLER